MHFEAIFEDFCPFNSMARLYEMHPKLRLIQSKTEEPIHSPG